MRQEDTIHDHDPQTGDDSRHNTPRTTNAPTLDKGWKAGVPIPTKIPGIVESHWLSRSKARFPRDRRRGLRVRVLCLMRERETKMLLKRLAVI